METISLNMFVASYFFGNSMMAPSYFRKLAIFGVLLI